MSELSKNAGKAAGTAARGVASLARSSVKTAKRLSRIARLNLNLADERKTVKRLYTEVGRLYFEAHRDDPEGFFVQLFQQLDASMEAIEAMEAELALLKRENEPEDADYEDAPDDGSITVEIETEPADGQEPEPACEEAAEPDPAPEPVPEPEEPEEPRNE